MEGGERGEGDGGRNERRQQTPLDKSMNVLRKEMVRTGLLHAFVLANDSTKRLLACIADCFNLLQEMRTRRSRDVLLLLLLLLSLVELNFALLPASTIVNFELILLMANARNAITVCFHI